jgi:FAD-dependent halogenase
LHFYDFLLAFYDANKDTNSYFWHARQIVKSKEASHVAFINLVAGVGQQETLYTSEDQFVRQRTRWGAILFPLIAGESEPAQSDEGQRDSFYNELLDESVQIQLQAWKLSPRQLPLLRKGLVVSRDGLHWACNSSR